MFFWPACLDRYLAPRFFFVSTALIISLLLLWKDLKENGQWNFQLPDMLLLGWYGLNLASVSWAFSWSEGVFYAQKTWLLFLVYWLSRQALLRDETLVRQTLRTVFTLITWAICGILIVQVGIVVSKYGFNNEKLYDYTSGLSGNKSLAADFLFFLLIFHVLLQRELPRRSDLWIMGGMLTVLIVTLQTRTVYLALAAAVICYTTGRAAIEAEFRRLFMRRLLPAGLLLGGVLVALLVLKGHGSTLAERLNPLTYLDSQTADERRFVWYRTDQLNRDRPWLGVGDGSWKFWFPSKSLEGGYRMEEKNVVFTRAHNDYLEIRSELGLVGVIWFCALFVLFGAIGLGTVFNRQNELSRRQDALVLLSGLLGYCIIQFLDFPRERMDLQVLLALIFAWLAHGGGNLSWSRNLFPFPKWLFAGLSGAGLLFSAVIGWERMNGDIHNTKLLEMQGSKNWNGLVKESKAAENPFNEYSEVAIPFAWHEGVAWYQLNKMDKALEAFQRAYRLNPWSFQVVNNYGSALVQNRRFQDAVKVYEEALAINPRFDDAKFNISFAYLQLGNYTKSMEWINRVDTIPNPGNADDREKNRKTLARQADFMKTIEQKMK